jgi:phage terminase large subunit
MARLVAMRVPHQKVQGESSCLFQGGQKGRPCNSAYAPYACSSWGEELAEVTNEPRNYESG